ncbi:MAG: hypothetical protein IKK08_00735 [Clostridia bacterium]|nr:hypothetical protein [Clostridia bacterium]
MKQADDRKKEQMKKNGECKKGTASAKVMQEQSRRDHSDVLGSYTGTPADGGMPVQDADDL